jgi:uncharacterized glyoxalase superfamily protein PhnB
MITELSHVYLVVNDHEEAIQWYQDKLGLELRTNETFGEGMRWVTMGVPGQALEFTLLAVSDYQQDERLKQVGHVSGWVFNSNDCRKDIEDMRAKGVKITLEPEEQMWGIQAAIEDLYGNSFVIVQPPQR